MHADINRGELIKKLNAEIALRNRYAIAITALSNHLLDLIVIPHNTALRHINKSSIGQSNGDIYKREFNNSRYMVKEIDDNAIQEFISSALFKRALFHKAPKISLTDRGYIASKFIEGDKSSTSIGFNYTEYASIFSTLKGIEEILAAAMRFADIDPNPSNILKIEIEKILVKVDHGWAFTSFFTREEQMRKAFFDRFHVYAKHLNLETFKQAVQKICSIEDSEIEDMIERQIYKLKKVIKDKLGTFTIGIDKVLINKYRLLS